MLAIQGRCLTGRAIDDACCFVQAVIEFSSGHGMCPDSMLMVEQRMTGDIYRACSYIAGKPETGDLVMLVLHKWVGAR